MNLRSVGRISFWSGLAGIAWLILPLRLANPELNQATGLGVAWLVIIAFGLAGLILPERTWARLACSIPFAVLAFFYFAGLILSMVGGGPLSGYELVDSTVLPHSTVKAYRINGGATTDYAIRITHEMTILPGIVVARDLHRGPHGSTASLTQSTPGTVTVTINSGRPNAVTLALPVRSFVYF